MGAGSGAYGENPAEGQSAQREEKEENPSPAHSFSGSQTTYDHELMFVGKGACLLLNWGIFL
jgi:hypothetical protein